MCKYSFSLDLSVLPQINIMPFGEYQQPTCSSWRNKPILSHASQVLDKLKLCWRTKDMYLYVYLRAGAASTDLGTTVSTGKCCFYYAWNHCIYGQVLLLLSLEPLYLWAGAASTEPGTTVSTGRCCFYWASNHCIYGQVLLLLSLEPLYLLAGAASTEPRTTVSKGRCCFYWPGNHFNKAPTQNVLTEYFGSNLTLKHLIIS